MYNGIGLVTPRGSGTSGYVQSNKFNLRGNAYQVRDAPRHDGEPQHRKPNKDILEHNKKREVELEVEVMRAQLEDEGVPEEEIEGKLTAYRAELMARLQEASSAATVALHEERAKQETHQIAARKMAQMDRLRGALGLGEAQQEGEAFDRELQERRRQEKIAEREQRERERRRAAERAEKERRREARRREKEAEAAKEARRKEEKAARRAREAEEHRWKSDGYYTRETEETERYRPSESPAGEDVLARKRPRSASPADTSVPPPLPAEEPDKKELARSPVASPPRKSPDRRRGRSPSPSRSPPRRRESRYRDLPPRRRTASRSPSRRGRSPIRKPQRRRPSRSYSSSSYSRSTSRSSSSSRSRSRSTSSSRSRSWSRGRSSSSGRSRSNSSSDSSRSRSPPRRDVRRRRRRSRS